MKKLNLGFTYTSKTFTPKEGHFCYALFQPYINSVTTYQNGVTPLQSVDGQNRPGIILKIDLAAGTALVAPGTKTINRHGLRITGGQYTGLPEDTYFHIHEARYIPLNALENKYGNVPLNPTDWHAVQTWTPHT
ncbi:hypothetical protein [Deinococcus kurensis]|uniref:hypothetical protein n=1 Tax=Deinococcus kurensis TaxID=2662757 RepID=UPI0012D3424F|nr:hypothetical protein [Deinococcus kurensis]